jgi:hypothetical protein
MVVLIEWCSDETVKSSAEVWCLGIGVCRVWKSHAVLRKFAGCCGAGPRIVRALRTWMT